MAKIQLDEYEYPAILAGQPSNKVLIIQLLSSHIHKVSIVLHSSFVQIRCVVSIPLENRFVHS